MEIIYYSYKDTIIDGVLQKSPDPQFKNIDKIMMSGDGVRNLVQYRGSEEELLDLTDYNEYGWKFLVNKYGVNDEFILNYLEDKSIATDYSEINTLSRVFCPTLTKNSGRTILDDIKEKGLSIGGYNISIKSVYQDRENPYFTGLQNVNEEPVKLNLDLQESDKFFVDLERGDNPRISFSTNNQFLKEYEVPDDGEDAGTIIMSFDVKDLFPLEVCSYFGSIIVGDQRLYMMKIPTKYSKVDFLEGDDVIFTAVFDKDETKYNKIYWFVVTSGGIEKISDINLSRIAWEHNKNPHRNIGQYLLSEKEKNRIDMSPEVCVNDWGTTWIDMSSGTLLGNKNIEDPILYNSIADKYRENKDWDKNVRYRSGSIVDFDDKEWESLVDNNLGNIPTFSDNWAIRDSILKSRVEKLYLECSTTQGGLVTPGIFTKPRSSQVNKVKVEVIYNPGYIINEANSSRLTIDNLKVEDFKAHKFNGGKIEPAIYLPGDSPKINFKKYLSEVRVSPRGVGVMGSTNLNFTLITDQETKGKNSARLEGETGYKISVNPNITDGQLYVDNVTLEYQVEDNTVLIEDVDFTLENNNIVFSGIIDSPAAYQYYLNIAKRYYEVKIIDYTGFYVSSTKERVLDGETTKIKLYPVDDDFDSDVNIMLSGNNGTVEFRATNTVVNHIHYPNNSIVNFAYNSDEGCYVLEILGGIKSEGKHIQRDLNVSIWR